MLRFAQLAFVLLACSLLAACPPRWLPPIPEPEPLPPLDPDPLAASGPGLVHAELSVKVPVLALGSTADMSTPLHYGAATLALPLGLYPADAQRPSRQVQIGESAWNSADLSTGRLTYRADFSAVPLGSYSLRVAWWTYSYIEYYDERLRGPQFTLNATAPETLAQLGYPLLEGSGKVPGRILLPPQAGLQQLHFSYAFDAYAVNNLTYSVSPGNLAADGRLFFELRDLPPGGYAVNSTLGAHELTLGDIPYEAGEGFLLNNGSWPSFQHWPRRPADNMFFGFVRLTGAQDWTGDLRIVARPAGSSPESAPSGWVWLDPRSNNASGEIYGYVPWYPYYKDSHANWPPPGIGYGIAPLAEGSYDIYAELLGFAPGQRLSIPLLQNQALPPASKSDPRLFRDDRSKGAPWWLATPLELNLSAAQAQAFK